MKTRVVIEAWNDKPIPDWYSKEEYEKFVKAGWELLLQMWLSTDNPNNDKFIIKSVEVEE